ncbi:MAG: RNA polymerase sigma-70 factor [Microlunatus sp.]|nr:RNA polymerase sigma-70 factor [Microlunatus sp.]
MTGDERAAQFTELRPLLFTIAYEILGSATDADDVLQEAYLRWSRVDPATVRNGRSYLAQVVTRQSLNALRARARRREDYVGPWLPEPLLLDDQDAAGDVELAESVSMAMMVVLETLSPDERAVFVLREVFAFSHQEIADAIGKSSAAVRQIAHRARSHVHARRDRFGPVDAAEATAVTAQFIRAVETGDLDGLLSVLAPDVNWIADGGGRATAARNPVSGAGKVAPMILGLFRRAVEIPGVGLEIRNYNNTPGIVVHSADRLEGVFLLEVDAGVITNFYVVRNPEKLTAAVVPRTIGR